MPSRKKVHAEVANWFGKHYEHLNIAAVSNLSTNSALLVEAGLGYALTTEGALPFLKESRIRMILIYPEKLFILLQQMEAGLAILSKIL